MLAWRARDASFMLFFCLWGMGYWLSSRGALATKDLGNTKCGRFKFLIMNVVVLFEYSLVNHL